MDPESRPVSGQTSFAGIEGIEARLGSGQKHLKQLARQGQEKTSMSRLLEHCKITMSVCSFVRISSEAPNSGFGCAVIGYPRPGWYGPNTIYRIFWLTPSPKQTLGAILRPKWVANHQLQSQWLSKWCTLGFNCTGNSWEALQGWSGCFGEAKGNGGNCFRNFRTQQCSSKWRCRAAFHWVTAQVPTFVLMRLSLAGLYGSSWSSLNCSNAFDEKTKSTSDCI